MEKKTKTKTIIVYALVVWFMMWVVTDFLYAFCFLQDPEWAFLLFVYPLLWNIGLLSTVLAIGWRYLHEKTIIAVVWLLVLFLIAAALYWLINSANYREWDWINY